MQALLTAILLTAITSVFPDPPPSQGIVTAGTIRAVVNSLADRLDSSIERGATNIDRVRIQAGGEVWAAVNNFKIAYADMLDKTLNQVDDKVKDNLARLRSAVDAIERNAASDAAEIARLATQGLLIVPFSNKQSQVTRWSPAYEVSETRLAALGNMAASIAAVRESLADLVASADDGEATRSPLASAQADDLITLTLQGVFPASMDPGFKPTIRLAGGGQPIEPVHVTTQDIIFQLPRSVISAAGGRKFAKIPVSIPYKRSRLIFGSKRVEAEFTIGIIGLPASPGRIVVRNSTPITVPDRRHVVTVQYNQQSDRDDHDLNHCGPVEDPWIIVANTVRFVVDRAEGSTHTEAPVRVNNPSVCWHVRTEHHAIGTSDKLWWHFEYDVTSSHTDTNTTAAEVVLRWGDSRTFDVTPNNWRVVFDSFDGSHTELAAPEHGNRYLDIDLQGNKLRILARAVDAIPAPGR